MNKPVAWMETYKGEPNNLDWDKSNLNYGSEFHDVVPLYTHPVKEQELLDEIQALKKVNTKQADYIAEQKSAYEKLWKEHMELFWKHEQDTDLTNE